MLKELKTNGHYMPQLYPYGEKPLEQGFVRVKSLYGAPKHGTELTMIEQRCYDGIYFDDKEKIFKDRDRPGSITGMGLGNMWVGEVAEISGDASGVSLGQRAAGYGHLASTHDMEPSGILPMPERMSWQEAVCYDPLQFALSGLRDANCRIGDTVLVSGLGAIGQMAAQAAKLSGASLVAVSDPVQIRRKAALDNGADFAFDPDAEDIGLILRGMTGGKGVDIVIECSGKYMGIQQSIRALAYMGSMALVGWYQECKVPLNFGFEGHMNQQNIIFSRACSEPNRDCPRWDFERICRESWRLLSEGKLRCENLLYPVIDFAQCDKGYDRYIMKGPDESIKLGVRF